MLIPKGILVIPEETKSVAQKAFPKGNTYLNIRNELRSIFADDLFDDLYPDLGQPAESPARLALVTIMQHMENLPDRQAAVRDRLKPPFPLLWRWPPPDFANKIAFFL